MTYMVIETHLSYSVVLDESGRFLKVANMNHEVGQTVERVVPLAASVKKAVPIRMISAIGAAVACLALIFAIYWGNYMSPFASIYLTINPAVRLEISRRDTVVGLEGINGDGASLIEGYGFRGKSITQVTDDLLDRAIDMGFLSDGGMVTVNIDSPDEAWFESTGIALRQNLNDYLAERMTVTVEVKQYSQPAGPAPDSDGTQIPSKPTEPATQPPTSGDSDYGNSRYGDSAYDSSYTAPATTPTTAPATTPTTAPASRPTEKDSSYGDSSYGDSVYGTTAPPVVDGDSDYSQPEPDDDPVHTSAPAPDIDDGDSDYDAADDDSDSEYGDAYDDD